MYLIANGKLITRDSAKPYIENGGVVVDGTKILEVGETAALKAKYPAATFIDAKGLVIMPAFINAHSHIYSGLARGLSMKGHNPTNFYEILDGMWWKIDRHLTLEDTRRSAYTTYIDCIKTGCTTVFDHHASFCEIEGSLFAIEEVAKELGVGDDFLFDDMVTAASSLDKATTEVDLAWSGVGQYTDIMTPLHMCMIAAGVANDGVMVEPKLLKSITNSLGVNTFECKTETYRKAMSSAEATQLTEYMIGTVENGTG
ncbi:MAG: hypothetical protein EOM66_07225, partial [Clostridia bacterium]|nr:hypothetical protein [Clostridia bacterium]